MKQYFILFQEQSKINYTFLFCLYKISERNIKEKLYNYISFNSLQSLSDKINNVCGFGVSSASISRILNNKDYNEYFLYNSSNKTIILNNNFKKTASNTNKFIILNDNEINFLINKNDNLLNKYYLYLKYYCGFSKSKTNDFTAEQFLLSIGYNHKSGNNKTKLSKYNSLLCDYNLIKINKIRDKNGKMRNVYSIQQE